jgi:hypothetical protein
MIETTRVDPLSRTAKYHNPLCIHPSILFSSILTREQTTPTITGLMRQVPAATLPYSAALFLLSSSVPHRARKINGLAKRFFSTLPVLYFAFLSFCWISTLYPGLSSLLFPLLRPSALSRPPRAGEGVGVRYGIPTSVSFFSTRFYQSDP